jgi:hypothetical protein
MKKSKPCLTMALRSRHEARQEAARERASPGAQALIEDAR